MIRATYPFLDPLTGSVQSLGRSLSPSMVLLSKGLQPPVNVPCSRAGSRHSILQPVSSPDAVATGNRKNTFNTHETVPAPFNEFYPKRSGPKIPLQHAILPPEHFR